jgi:rubrerythrin
MQELDTTRDKLAIFFDVCAKIEGLCASLYHYYSDIFLNDTDVSQVWKKTALEEENHQRQFELASRLSNESAMDLNVDLNRTLQIHQKLDNLLNHVRRNPPDIVTALTKAIEMEGVLAALHLESSVHFHDESVRRMFLALQEFDQDHVKSLQHCLSIQMLPKAEMTG